jgi:nitrogen regulatory protein PII
MKLVQCIIRPEKLEEVVSQLANWTPGLTVAPVQDQDKERIGVYRGAQYRMLSTKMQVEIATDDNKVDDLVKVLVEMARTGETSDGRIFVLDIERAYHVRTGFMD